MRDRKIINFFGLLIIICGFFAPFLSSGKLPSIVFFWVGFLLFLWPNKYFLKSSSWPKWARIGLLLNILGILLLFLFSSLIVNTTLSSSYLASILLKITSWIFTPISTIAELFFPYKQTKLPDGSVQFTISFLREILNSFFNVLVYIVIGIIIGTLFFKGKR